MQPLVITVADDDLGDNTVELEFGCSCACTASPLVAVATNGTTSGTQILSSLAAPLGFGPVLEQTGYAAFSEPNPLTASWSALFKFADGVAGDIMHQRVTATSESFEGNGQPVAKMHVRVDDLNVLANIGGGVAAGDTINLAEINDWGARRMALPEVCKITFKASGSSQIGSDALVFPSGGTQFVPYDPTVHGQGQVATTVQETVYFNGTPVKS